MSNRFPQHDSAPVSDLQSPAPVPEDRCTHTSSDGRRCVLLRAAKNYPFCVYHAMDESLPDPQTARAALKAAEARAAQRLQRPEEDVTAELLGPTEDFCSATAINLALRRLVILLAGNRIAPRRAAVLAYTFQLILQSLGEVKNEFHEFEQDSTHISPRLENELKQIPNAASTAVPPAYPASNLARS